jgi:transcriptional regulator with XRE-family HTH domain
MTPVSKYNRAAVKILADQGMSQIEIADKLNIATSTVHRIKNELGITLKRKGREFGARHAYYREARESLQLNSERAEDGSGSGTSAEDTGDTLADRFAEVRNSRSPEARLKAKLENITDPYIRWEIELGHIMVEHENLARKGGAPGRVSNREIKRSPMSPSARTAAERLLKLMGPEDALTATQASDLIYQNVQRTSNYLEKLFEQGSLYRVRMLVRIAERTKRQWRWVYSKSPIENEHEWD